jgi:hypothetical protein
MSTGFSSGFSSGYGNPKFRPDTYFAHRRAETVNHSERFSLWRYFDGVPTEYVVIITSGVASPAPGRTSPSVDDINDADSGSGEQGLAVFRGGRLYEITGAENVILTTAGYTTI